MATAKSYMMARRATVTNYRFLTTDTTTKMKTSNSFEFDESDIWGGSTQSNSSEFCSPPPTISRAPARKYSGGEAMSVPVNVPDWSKILKEEYNEKWRTASNYNGGDESDEWVPPHEYLARTRNASLSVHEGIGRTLKGRDLSSVRNAIWEKTGFQD